MNYLSSVARGSGLRGMVLALCIFIPCCSNLFAAASWEWTKGQGWTEGAGAARESAKEQLTHAMRLEKKGEYYDAAKQYFLCIRVYPDTKEAGIALQRLAKCLFEMENYYQSYKAIDQVIQSYPDTGNISSLLAIEYKIGNKLAKGAKVTLLVQDEAEAKRKSYEAAAEVFNSVIKG
ncbi:MAG: hypothetical protein JXR97_12860, partial [Planctomycetes bacterium]|nr:hypothetical protein [Planctomycetota bacterium]